MRERSKQEDDIGIYSAVQQQHSGSILIYIHFTISKGPSLPSSTSFVLTLQIKFPSNKTNPSITHHSLLPSQGHTMHNLLPLPSLPLHPRSKFLPPHSSSRHLPHNPLLKLPRRSPIPNSTSPLSCSIPIIPQPLRNPRHAHIRRHTISMKSRG